jgi:hypothetical protein
MRRGFWIARGLKFLVIVAVVLGVVGFVVMSLWNRLVPSLFGGPMIDYWEALGLLVLARLLFGGLRPHGRGRWGHSWHHSRERWEQMTPEERERFRSRFRGGSCGFGGWHGHEGRPEGDERSPEGRGGPAGGEKNGGNT